MELSPWSVLLTDVLSRPLPTCTFQRWLREILFEFADFMQKKWMIINLVIITIMY